MAARQLQLLKGFTPSKEIRHFERHKKLWDRRAKLRLRLSAIQLQIDEADQLLEKDFGGKDEPPQAPEGTALCAN